MTGKDFIALRRLSTKADETLALPGETCERVPDTSLPALLASGKIRAVEPSDGGVADVGTGAPARLHGTTPIASPRRTR